MDSVVLDTNVVLDFFSATRLDHDLGVSLMQALQVSDVDIHVVATSLKDIYYILSHSEGESVARAAVTLILATMSVLPVDENCCNRALNSGEPDFEDGIIRVAAETARVDYLISRDARAFVGCLVPRLSPADALRELKLRS